MSVGTNLLRSGSLTFRVSWPQEPWTVPSPSGVRALNIKWTWYRYFLLSLNTIFIIFAGGLFGAAIWSELFYRNYFDVVDGQPVLVFLFRNVFYIDAFLSQYPILIGQCFLPIRSGNGDTKHRFKNVPEKKYQNGLTIYNIEIISVKQLTPYCSSK